MSPPGLAMISVSERAWSAAAEAKMPRFYFDLAKARKSLATGETPWTPAVGVLFAMDVALEMLENEGYQHIFARHAACAAAAQAGLQALGFTLFAEAGTRVADGHGRLAAGRCRLGGAQQADALATALSLPAVRIGWPDRSCASATWATSMPRMLSTPSASSASRSPSSAVTLTSQGATSAAQAASEGRATVNAVTRSRRIGGVRVLVAEPLAKEGLELLQSEHEVDYRPDPTRDDLLRASARLRRARRTQRREGRCTGDRRAAHV